MGTYNGLAIYNESGVISVGNNVSTLPKDFVLYQNYPNPFNPTTKIRYQLNSKSNVTLSVFDINGKTIKVLVNSIQQAGQYDIIFDAVDLPSGLYFYRLVADGYIETLKMILIK